MANTTSISFPNMFSVSQNKVSISTDDASIVNRVRLLMLTDPTEIYDEPEQGVGLRKYMYRYNNDNIKAIIKDNIISQLRLHEPCVDPDSTELKSGLLFSGSDPTPAQDNKLEATVAVKTKFGNTITIDINK